MSGSIKKSITLLLDGHKFEDKNKVLGFGVFVYSLGSIDGKKLEKYSKVWRNLGRMFGI